MAKSKKPKPSFDAPAGAGTGAAPSWVYRSDAEGPSEAPAAAKARRTAGATEATVKDEPPSPPRPAAAARAAEATAPAPGDRSARAQVLVDRYAKYAAAAGLMPVPIVDLAAIAGVQVAMLSALAGEYGVPFSRERGKTLLAALLGGLMPSLAGHQVLKVVGPLVGIISVAGFAMASTQAVGRVFVTHFEAGGTLLDIDVEGSRRQIVTRLNRS